MSHPMSYASDVAFTPAVKAIQQRKGSRSAYARMEQGGSWQTRITPQLQDMLASQTSFYLATASADGQPYIQHRGGPPGFLRALDDHTLGFVDYAGNRQYITAGNLSENPRVALFLMDYEHRQRVKIWGVARVVEGDSALTDSLLPEGYRARAEQVVLITVTAWDANCPQHIPQRLDADAVNALLKERDARISALQQELALLRAGRASGVFSESTGSAIGVFGLSSGRAIGVGSK